MGLINLFRGNDLQKEIKALTSQVAYLQTSLTLKEGVRYVNQNIAQYATWNEMKAGEKYCTMDDIYSIIRKLVSASLTVPMYPYYEKNTNAAKKLKAYPIGGDMFEQKMLQVKALEDLPEQDPVYQLLENPSLYQNTIEFYEELYSYLYIFGRVPIIKMRPDVGRNAGKPVNLEVLMPNCLIPKVSEGFPKSFITGYDYEVNGIKIMQDIPVDDIILIKYFNPHSTTAGLSPIEVLKKRVTRLDANMNNSVAQMQNGGVPGIVYDKDTTESAVEIVGQRKQAFYEYLQNKNNKGAPYFGSGELGYIQLGLKLADLDAANLADIDFDKVCNVYSVSSVLFNNKKANTESNVKEMRKALYTDAALPNVYRVAAALEHSLNIDFTDKTRIIQPDITGIPELQQDMKYMAECVAALPFFVPNEVREMFKLDKSTDPNADRMLVKTGYVFLDDLQGGGDLPETEDYND